MADIATNTLQIGSNNLILQDAGARQNIATNTQDISDLKDGYSELKEGISVNHTANAGNWEQGGMNSSGTAVSASNRVRTVTTSPYSFPSMILGLNVTCLSGYQCGIRKRRRADGTGSLPTEYDNSWYSGSVTFKIDPAYYYIFLLRRTDNADFTPSDVADGTLAYSYITFTDKTLSVTDKAADAKTVGDALASINNAVTALESYVDDQVQDVSDNIDKVISPVWEKGNISTSAPWNSSSSTRIRTALNEIPIGKKTTVSFDATKVKVSIRLYDKDGKFLKPGESTTFFNGYDYSTDWVTESPITITNNSTIGYYRLCATYLDNAEITDINDVASAISVMRDGVVDEYGIKISSNPVNIEGSINRDYPLYATVCAVKERHESGKLDRTIGYLYRENVSPFRFYYASGTEKYPQYIFTWNSTLANGLEPMNYAFAVTDEGDVIAVFRGELNGNSGSTGDVRSDPIVYPHDDYTNPVRVSITGMDKPTAWLMNTGVYCEADAMYFVEYTRPRHTTANLWKVSAPYTSATDWEIKKTYVANVDIEHWHHITRDPFSGIMYASTGDEDAESIILYSTDDGDTWSVLRSGDQKVCRQLNFIFTEKYVYMATDALSSSSNRVFIRTTRDSNGLLKTSDADIEILYTFNYPGFATYHLCYWSDPECILLLERSDSKSSSYLGTFYIWDIQKSKMRYGGSFEPNGNVYLGFRCEAVSHYPEITKDKVVCGFSLFPDCLKYKGNPDVAEYLGNRGVITSDAYNNNVFNNLILNIQKYDKYMYNDNH